MENKKNSNPDEVLVPMATPALILVLEEKEKQKGSPLTEQEVLEARDNCICITVPFSMKTEMEVKRGYADLDIDGPVWNQWQKIRTTLS